MRKCFLSAGLSCAEDSWAYVLGNPKAWLGTAYHEVLEKLPAVVSNGSETQVLQRAETLWNQAIARLEQKAASHPLNHRFGSSIEWKGYYLIHETLRLRVAELFDVLTRHPKTTTDFAIDQIGAIREKQFSTMSGRLRGRIDLVRDNEIIDYKTGKLFENAGVTSTPFLKGAYIRQLQIYAYILHATTGHWPKRGLLYPAAGPPVAVDLEPATCEIEAIEAIELLDRYNKAVSLGDVRNLASPSPDACRWCPFKGICPEFWAKVSYNWATTLDGEAVSGHLLADPLSVHGGAAWSVMLSVDSGTIANCEITISPLNVAVHKSVSQYCHGNRLRIVSLARRTSGALFPKLRTVVFCETDAPTIEIDRSAE